MTGVSTPAPGGPSDDALATALAAVGDRWSLAVVAALADGPLRFGELSAVVGAAPNVLTQRLRQLDGAGIVASTPYSHRPLRLTYALTADGEALAPVIAALRGWAARRSGGATVTHAVCGTPLDLVAWCPTCERVVDAHATAGSADLHHL
jgi:DNA-binding HxlR family transcriptional regulator